MPSASNPSLQHQLKDRLLNLTPRAFELFAGDLLTYLGLRNIEVTRYVGDQGVDASGLLTVSSSFMDMKTGVQVKRYRNNVQRAEIDRFIGALVGKFQYGIYITTAGYSPQARKKAQEGIIRVNTIDGDQTTQLMIRHKIGLTGKDKIVLEEGYFVGFEQQARSLPQIAEQPIKPQAEPVIIDLITLQALSYELRRDRYTVRDWIEQGKLLPDQQVRVGYTEQYFFRRDRVQAIREQFNCAPPPENSEQWRQDFLEFSKSRTMTRSYKPVLLQALLKHIDREGVAAFDAVAAEFREFYIQRFRRGEIVEFKTPELDNPETLSIAKIKQLIIEHPLQRFIIQGFLRYDKTNDTICIVPELWNELRYTEVLEVQRSIEEQIRYYYAKQGRK